MSVLANSNNFTNTTSTAAARSADSRPTPRAPQEGSSVDTSFNQVLAARMEETRSDARTQALRRDEARATENRDAARAGKTELNFTASNKPGTKPPKDEREDARGAVNPTNRDSADAADPADPAHSAARADSAHTANPTHSASTDDTVDGADAAAYSEQDASALNTTGDAAHSTLSGNQQAALIAQASSAAATKLVVSQASSPSASTDATALSVDANEGGKSGRSRALSSSASALAKNLSPPTGPEQAGSAAAVTSGRALASTIALGAAGTVGGDNVNGAPAAASANNIVNLTASSFTNALEAAGDAVKSLAANAPGTNVNATSAIAPGIVPVTTTVALSGSGDVPGAPVAYEIATPLSNPAFSRDLAQVVSMSIRDNIQEAEIRIEPRDLGPITLRIRLEGDVAQVNFVAVAVETRNALDAGMERLREALAGSGIELGQANVSAGEGRREQFSSNGVRGARDSADSDLTTETTAISVSTGRSMRLIDTFA